MISRINPKYIALRTSLRANMKHSSVIYGRAFAMRAHAIYIAFCAQQFQRYICISTRLQVSQSSSNRVILLNYSQTDKSHRVNREERSCAKVRSTFQVDLRFALIILEFPILVEFLKSYRILSYNARARAWACISLTEKKRPSETL
jgi:hypothetical protein